VKVAASGGDGESAAPKPAPSNDVFAITPRPAPSKAFGLEIEAFGLEMKNLELYVLLKEETTGRILNKFETSSAKQPN
jgi:hypothetical protein